MMGRGILFALVLAMALGHAQALAQTSSISARARAARKEDPPPAAPRENPRIKRNLVYERYCWTAAPPKPPKVFKVHDLITIVVRERLKFEADADLETKKTYDLKSELDAFLKCVDHGVGAATFARGKPNIDYRFKNNLRSEADTSREDRLTTRVTGKIIDVKPNGTLVIEARRKVNFGEESSEISITGTCRKEDVSADNTVLSTQIANTVVTVHNEGALDAAARRGWIPRLLDLLKPF